MKTTQRAAVVVEDGGRAVVTVRVPVAPPPPVEAPPPRGGAPRRPEIPAPAPPVALALRDLGTWPWTTRAGAGALQTEWRERPLEGPPVPLFADLERNKREMLQQFGGTFVPARSDARGVGVERAPYYRLQADAQTAATNALVTIDGPTDTRECAVAPGAPYWTGPASIADARASAAAVRERLDATSSRDGVDRWDASIDAREDARYGPYSAGREGREGLMRVPVAEGRYLFGVDAPDAWEPWFCGDRHRYKVTLEPSYYAAEVDPPELEVSRTAASDVELYLSPRTHRVTTHWLASYLLAAGWWAVLLYYPTVRTFTLRAPFYPRYEAPVGTPEGSYVVGDTWSHRLGLTQHYAGAIAADADFAAGSGGFFQLVDRIQGRYALYRRPLQEAQLCAVLVFRFPFGVTRTYYVHRKVAIVDGANVRTEVNGLATQEVKTWTPNVFANQSNSIGDGI